MKKNELAALVDYLGQPVTLEQTKLGMSKDLAKVLTQTTAKAPEAIVNAYGVNGREFVFKKDDLDTPPERFDVVTFNGERFVLDTEMTLYEPGGAVIGWRAFAKGK